MRTAVVLAAAILGGCSGAVQPVWDTNSDDGGTDAGVIAPDDSLSVTNCPNTNVWRHKPGSWVLASPQIHLVFWGSWWSTTAGGTNTMSVETQAWNVLAADPAFTYPVQEYGVGASRLAGTFQSYWDIPTGQLSETTIQNELTTEIQNGTLPNGDNQAIYVLLLPPDTQSAYDIGNKFGGHHNTLNGFTYAIIESHTNLDAVISHEVYEACTNPDTSSGWWGANGETEVGDLCSPTWNLDGYTLSTAWSEKNCQCIPSSN